MRLTLTESIDEAVLFEWFELCVTRYCLFFLILQTTKYLHSIFYQLT